MGDVFPTMFFQPNYRGFQGGEKNGGISFFFRLIIINSAGARARSPKNDLKFSEIPLGI